LLQGALFLLGEFCTTYEVVLLVGLMEPNQEQNFGIITMHFLTLISHQLSMSLLFPKLQSELLSISIKPVYIYFAYISLVS
jgi:hypothetical protein